MHEIEKFTALEEQLNTLLERHVDLKKQVQHLLSRENELINERAALMKKNEQARSRVESMISRLKIMEQGS